MKKAATISLRLMGWLVTLAAVVAVLGVLALMVGPRLLGWQGLIVFSGSMEPALKVGGLALVEPIGDSSAVKVGDVITYHSLKDRDKLISHRVIEVIRDGDILLFRAKGDASDEPDATPIPAGNVIGKVRFHIPYLGYAADKLRHRENFYLLMGIPAALLIINEVANIARELRKLRGRKEAAP